MTETSKRDEVNDILTKKRIPHSLAPCFQEYDFDRLEPNAHADLIIERVLAYGDRQEVRWLLECYGQERVVEWIGYLGARRLPWRRYNLWCVLFGLAPARRPRSEEQRIWLH